MRARLIGEDIHDLGALARAIERGALSLLGLAELIDQALFARALAGEGRLLDGGARGGGRDGAV
ncbi:MAG: hypothetical protein AB7J28_14745, partial [Hyphomonadaceae bacterium]